MHLLSLPVLFLLLLLLVILSACFSGSETALMRVNRYQLMHLVRQGNHRAKLAQKLLERPDRLIGLILLGNNFVNIMASAITTIAFLRIAGDSGVLVGTVFLTVVILIFSEVAPKTLAAIRPLPLALIASVFLYPLLTALYPLVKVINSLANWVLKPFNVSSNGEMEESPMSRHELRTLLEESGSAVPQKHRQMLINVLSLEESNVEDIMVPRPEMLGINVEQDLEALKQALIHHPFSRCILYRNNLDDIVGIFSVQKMLTLADEPFTRTWLESKMRKPYFVPITARLNHQLLEFQRLQRRLGLVVNEYGDVVGLITLADILEEISNDLTQHTPNQIKMRRIEHLPDGALRIDARIAMHSLKRRLGWDLPTDQATTLNGLLLYLHGDLPKPGEVILTDFYHFQVESVADNRVQWVIAKPRDTPHDPFANADPKAAALLKDKMRIDR